MGKEKKLTEGKAKMYSTDCRTLGGECEVGGLASIGGGGKKWVRAQEAATKTTIRWSIYLSHALGTMGWRMLYGKHVEHGRSSACQDAITGTMNRTRIDDVPQIDK